MDCKIMQACMGGSYKDNLLAVQEFCTIIPETQSMEDMGAKSPLPPFSNISKL